MSSIAKGVFSLAIVAVIAYVAVGQIPTPIPVDKNVGDTRVAIHGYDPVSYFTVGEAQRGSDEFQFEYKGAIFQFASAEHRNAFVEDSEKFIPAYGGFCSYGVTLSQKFDVDPQAWEIVNGKLYLQLDPGTRNVWKNNIEDNISNADRAWQRIRDIPASEL